MRAYFNKLLVLCGMLVFPGMIFYFQNPMTKVAHASENKQPANVLESVGKVRKMSMQTASVKVFLQTAIIPVGKVMYIYGGGWNEADTGSGIETVTLGISGQWVNFEKEQTSGYDHRNYNYKANVEVIHLGLDCSGYVGWTLYNTFQTENGRVGYVDFASDMGDNLSRMGYGKMREISEVMDYKAGDIMTNSEHIWIVLGECSDGSVVLLHASPPGVQISGTTTIDGSYDSEAIALATEYMKKYFPEWYERFPDSSRNREYLTGYRQFRFDIKETEEDKALLWDMEGYQEMSAKEVLKNLFDE